MATSRFLLDYGLLCGASRGFGPAEGRKTRGKYALKAALQRSQPELVGKCVSMRTQELT